ncbi:hypothetical protein C1H46_042663 [Malus baccata]|uniref:Alpha-ketoglutarate-dependent dioxygenase AlkB-like domain-containing protein n=1 Tax=Malus baccata TaxID=106549 RepID=A0A540KC48_MALBA|nr:hypothetical protein C1H46_042663 [Malus baccata]
MPMANEGKVLAAEGSSDSECNSAVSKGGANCQGLGCKAIFLLGGKHRKDPPTAMFLRSGDVVLMARKRGNAFMACLGYSLTEKMLKLCLLKSSSLTRKMFCVLEYIPTSRININIRPVF